MALMRRSEELSAAAVRNLLPTATLKPNAGESSYTDEYIVDVFSTRCFDEGAELRQCVVKQGV